MSPSEPGPTTGALGMGSCSGEVVLDFILWPSLEQHIPGWSLSSDLEFWLLPGPQAETFKFLFHHQSSGRREGRVAIPLLDENQKPER